MAQINPSAIPWDMNKLTNAPKWKALERPKSDRVKAISFSGLSFRGQPTRVFAWLGIPQVEAGKKVPAMVLIHGGGGTAFEEWVRLWVDRGYAAIAMDTCGQIPVGNYGDWVRDAQSGPPGWGGFDQVNWPREDQWTCHAVADAILAHSLIRSLPEVDPDRTGVTGISWGGYLTCIVAGVDRRFKLAVPVYGCGFYRDTVFEGDLKRLSPEDAARWMAWWDPSVFLGDAEMPLLWVTGSNDFAYTMNALQLSYRLPKGRRTLCIRLRMPHAHGGPGENPEEIRVFADSLLKGGAALAHITGMGREGASVWATYDAPVTVVKAELNYTKDSGRWQDRKWEAIPVQTTHGRVDAILPEGTCAYYFNLFDARDCVVSTEHETMVPIQTTPTLNVGFTNPVVARGADPWVIRHGGSYYFCQSDRQSVRVNRCARLQDLGTNHWQSVWTPPSGTPYSKELWAPELHYLQGKWWIYVAADDGDNFNHRMYVLEGSTDDPQAPFHLKGKIAAPTDRWAIDATVLQMPDDKLYLVWSGWEGTENVAQHLYIAPMSNPWTMSGERVRISSPEFDWEKQGGSPLINEGPEALWHGGKLFLIYSASGSWSDDYCLGQLAWTGGDVMDPNSWIKKPAPVFSRTPDVFGPGHGSFAKSPDGKEDWIIYHSATSSGAGWNRRVNVQRFSWHPDGSPDFGTPVAAGVLLPEPSNDSVR